MPDKIIEVLKKCLMKDGGEDNFTLFISNIPKDTETIELRKFLGNYGMIKTFNHIVKESYKTSIAYI